MIYSQQVIADGASNYWRLNESSGLVAVDIIGGKNGTISGGVTLGQTGAVTEDKSMLFDGISGQINAGQVPNANYLAGSYTIEAWLYSTNPNNYCVIVSKGHSESPTGWRAFLGNSNAPILFSDSDVSNPYPASTLITVPNKWQHVIWGYDAIAGKVFYAVNGVYEAIGVLNRSVTSTDPITISADSTLGYIFKGGIDEVAIYPLALTAAQISNHYSLRNSTSVGVVPLISPGPVTPLIQNVVYALPAAKCQLLSEVVCQTSSNLTGPFADLTGSNVESGKLTQGGFVRCATGNTNIVVKKHTVQKAAESKYASTVKYDGASNYWRLGELSGTTAVDIIGGKNGAITGGVTLNQTGATNDGDGSMTFDGISGRVTVSSSPAIGTGAASLEWWFKTTIGGQNTWPIDMKNDGDSSRAGVACAYIGTGVYFAISPGGGIPLIYALADPFPYADGNWHHYVGVVTRGVPDTSWLYIDGTLRGSVAHSANGWNLTNTLPFTIGAALAADFSKGSFDEVAFYPVALTPAQIQNHYKLSAYSTSKYSALVVADGASNYWKLNELSGTSAIDMIGGKNGTISGGVSLGQAGAIDKSMTFDGTTGKVLTAANVSIPVVFTLECWLKTTDMSGAVHSFFTSGSSSGNLYSGKFYGNIQGTGLTAADGAQLISNGQWHHLVWVVKTSGMWDVYVDAVLDTLNYQTSVYPNVATNLPVYLPLLTFLGSVDDVAIYPYALTPSQILAHYNAR